VKSEQTIVFTSR